MVLQGIVQKHLGRGKKLGFPTANIPVASQTEEGIFVGVTKIDDEYFPCLIFVGSPVTFGETDKKAEIYLLDFNRNIYDKHILVHAHKKIRDNMKFNSEKELVEQIHKDVEVAREYFSRTLLIEF